MMELLWGRPGLHPPAVQGRPQSQDPASASVTTCRSKVEVIDSSSSTYRVLAFALLGLMINLHGASRGRREWALRYDGSFAQVTQRSSRTGLTVTLGLDTVHAYVSASACLLLLVAFLTARRWLSLPALLLSAADLLNDVSDSVLATCLLLFHAGLSPAVGYALFATLVIGLEIYLWTGVLRWYEQGLAMAIKRLEQQRLQRITPSTASSASSVMD